MAGRRRSASQLMQELQELQRRPDIEKDRLTLLHEISSYQEELQAQNEALVRAQAALEETRDRFIELYDFAPTGYLTLDDQGVIRQCNLTTASLLGKSKAMLEGLPLLGFVEVDDRGTYFEFLRRCRGASGDIPVDLALRTGNGLRRVEMLCRPRLRTGSSPDFLTSLIDITERRAFERERERMAREHAQLAGRLISVQEAERTRIARNLHDDIGQEITALRMMLELLAGETAPAAMSDAVGRAQQTLRSLDQRLHFVASDLRPAALDLGIGAALNQFAEQWTATFGVPIAFHCTGKMEMLTSDEATHIYRIAQEALNNISKHAGASKVKLTIARHGDVVELRVHDNGRGFDQEAIRRNAGGLGLVGMRERAQLMGGHLEVESSHRGTVVTVRVAPAPRPPKLTRGGAGSPAEQDGGAGARPIAAAHAGTRPPRRAPPL